MDYIMVFLLSVNCLDGFYIESRCEGFIWINSVHV